MRCIFCKQPSASSRSVEHIIPESLGNTEHMLRRSIVCDGCNNYFSRDVERPFMESAFINEQRFHRGVPSKRGKIPPVTGIHLESLIPIQMFRSAEAEFAVAPLRKSDSERWAKSIVRAERGSLIMPIGVPVNDRITSRFIAKIGLEVLAHRCREVPGGLDEVVDKPELDPLRRYARHGDNVAHWPVKVRSLYPPNFPFIDGTTAYETLHEYMIHHVPFSGGEEYYIVVAIFGIEYALNLAGPELEGYEQWMKENAGRSPLYPGEDLSAFWKK